MDNDKLNRAIESVLCDIFAGEYHDGAEVMSIKKAELPSICKTLEYALRDAYNEGRTKADTSNAKHIGELSSIFERLERVEAWGNHLQAKRDDE